MNLKDIRLIVMDIDGTLVNSQRQLTQRTKEALIRLEEHGICLALASGRPYKGLVQLAKELKMDEYEGILISSNGARAEILPSRTVRFENAIPTELAQEVLEHLKQFEVYPMIEEGDYMLVNNVYQNEITCKGQKMNIIDYEAHSNGFLLKESHDLVKSVNFSPAKILTAGSDDYLQAHYQDMEAPFKDRLDCMFTAPFYFEYTAKDTNKGAAIDSLGYEKEQIVAIGDAQNDLPMFKKAGIKIAMGNAVDQLKAAADIVVDDNNNDGIGKWIEQTFPEYFQ
ncbi:MAG: Cof-type HAD-IIB family hydrolase [Erysipelotrichaceae bacterium]|nr:Cof-type HAD-IIB family hydrolase [Erysipelotrichaceae bacterium]